MATKRDINMLEMVKEAAEKMYPGDEAKIEEFVQGFMNKVAGLGDILGQHFSLSKGLDSDTKTPTFGGSLAKGVGEQLGRGVTGAGINLGIAGIGYLANQVGMGVLKVNFSKAMNEAIQNNKILRQADKTKLWKFGETIFKFAPHVSTDSNVLTWVLSNAISGESIDGNTVKMLVELESRYTQNKSFSPKDHM